MKLYNAINMQQTTDLISSVGKDVTVIVQGELGCGKSSILKEMAKRFPDHTPIYADMTTKDVGDFLVPNIREVDGAPVCSFIPNEEFGFHINKPVIILLDEIGKCAKAVLNASLRLMLERKLGMFSLHPDSIVFGTTNLSIEGVGDNLPPHARNRVSVIKMRKPTAVEWVEDFALHNGVDPVVVATVVENPSMLASFEEYESPDQNHYINDPRSPRTAFVTPRSLEKASNIIKGTRGMHEDIITHALIGTVGEKAAMDVMTMMKLDIDLPRWKDIIAAPDKVAVPTNAAANCMLVAKAVQMIEADTVDAWCVFLQRMKAEAQGLFCRSVSATASPKRTIAMRSSEYTKICLEKSYLF